MNLNKNTNVDSRLESKPKDGWPEIVGKTLGFIVLGAIVLSPVIIGVTNHFGLTSANFWEMTVVFWGLIVWIGLRTAIEEGVYQANVKTDLFRARVTLDAYNSVTQRQKAGVTRLSPVPLNKDGEDA